MLKATYIKASSARWKHRLMKSNTIDNNEMRENQANTHRTCLYVMDGTELMPRYH